MALKWNLSLKDKLDKFDMKFGCCENCNCVSKKIRDPGCTCGNHELSEESE